MKLDEFNVLGFDYGLKYLGVASGQTLTKTANSLSTLKVKNGSPNWKEIEKLIQIWRPRILIVGMPLTLNDEEQLLSYCAKKFGKRLQQKFSLPVEYCNEQLTSWEAKEACKRKKNESSTHYYSRINAFSAKIIVDEWLNNL